MLFEFLERHATAIEASANDNNAMRSAALYTAKLPKGSNRNAAKIKPPRAATSRLANRPEKWATEMMTSRNIAGAAGLTEPSRKANERTRARPMESRISSADFDVESVRARGSAK